MLGTGDSGRRVSFEVELGPAIRSCPVVCRTNSAGHSPVQQSTRVEGLRLCHADLGQTVHVLIGSVSCGLEVRSVIRSRGRSNGTGAKEQVAVGVLLVQVVHMAKGVGSVAE